MSKIIILKVDKKNDKTRVDIFINSKQKDLSRTRVKNLILDENLKINNIIIKDPSKKINYNDLITIGLPEPKKVSLKPFNFKLDIVYEDDDLIVINKPAGIAMHPGPGNYDNTIVNGLIHYDKESLSNINGELRPGIVHRIDKNTSGLIVVAKNNQAHENLSSQFSNHSIIRVYELLIWGKVKPSKGRIDTLITRSSKNRQMMETSNTKGKRAITNYQTIQAFRFKTHYWS